MSDIIVPGQQITKRLTGVTKDTQDLLDKVALDVAHENRHLFDSLSDHEKRAVIQHLSEAVIDPNVTSGIHDLLWEVDYHRKPVDVMTFLTDPYFLGRSCSMFHPKWLEDFEAVFAPGSPIFEWILTGAIGIGKTTISCAALAYKIYTMSCLRDPSGYYGLLPDSKVVFGIYSITKYQVEDAAYSKLRGFLDGSPYFAKEFPRDRRIDSKINFTKAKMQVVAGSTELHALGLDLFAFMMDEVNFMKSKDNKETGEVTGQAYDLYNATHTRLLSRFMRPGGTIPGMMFLLSSRNSETSFLEGHLKKQKDSLTSHISDYPLWEVKPAHRFTQPMFRVEVGDRVARSRVLKDDEETRPGAKIVEIPGEFRTPFNEDVDQALRDIAGVATFNLSPLVRDRQSIFDAYRDHLVHPFTREEVIVDLEADERLDTYFNVRDVCSVQKSKWVPRMNPHCPRYIHIDIGLTGDCLGFAMGHVSGRVTHERTNPDGLVSTVENPFILIDMMLRVRPPIGSEIDLSKIRGFILYLSRIYSIERVTFDGFQSADSIQILRKKGFQCGKQSVDRTDEAYLMLRSALFERRIAMYSYEPYEVEMLDLERDVKKRKVDHPLKNSKGGKGSKDVTDGVAGVTWLCLTDPNAMHPSLPVVTAEDAVPSLDRAVDGPTARSADKRRIGTKNVNWDRLRGNL